MAKNLICRGLQSSLVTVHMALQRQDKGCHDAMCCCGGVEQFKHATGCKAKVLQAGSCTGVYSQAQAAPGKRLKLFSYGIIPSVGGSVNCMCNDAYAGLQECHRIRRACSEHSTEVSLLSSQESSGRQKIVAS